MMYDVLLSIRYWWQRAAETRISFIPPFCTGLYPLSLPLPETLTYVSEFHFLYSTNITCKDRRPTGESVGDYKPNIENVKIRIGSIHASWLCQGSRRESRLDGSYESSGPSSRHDHDNMLNLQLHAAKVCKM